MPFQFHDTLTGSKIALTPRTPGEASIYLCGPTVYNFIHVGNARPAVVFDVLVRHLRASGLKVTYVRNFTDVDDKIIKAALEQGVDPKVITERYVQAYLEDTSALNCTRPDVEPRVSQHIPEIIAMIEALIAKGHAYVREGDVMFAVRTFDRYARLSRRDIEDLRAGERVAVDERKDDPLDFALWKSAKPHEPASARWPSPWGEGRPGWHIECSAMARKHLGDGFDIHAGGIDLIFPHHENEIAQSECATGHTFARGWMHNGFININDEKISKSRMAEMGSVAKYFVLRTVLQHVDPEAVRYWLLGTHYRSPVNFEMAEGASEGTVTFPGLEEAEKRVEYFYETRARLAARLERVAQAKPATNIPKGKGGEDLASQLRRRFDAALDDDLNTAGALAPVADAYRRANELCDNNKSDPAEVRAFADLLAHMSAVLGVAEGAPDAFFARVRARRVARRGIDAGEIDRLVEERLAARQARDFARADAIRDDLLRRGIEVRDNPSGGSTWKVN